MKKTSIFLILATVVALMFTGCNQILGEDTTATLEDFEGNWYYQQDTTDLVLTVRGDTITLDGISAEPMKFIGKVTNGQFKAIGFDGEMLLTINPANILITVRSDLLYDKFKKNEIIMTKKISFNDFVPDTTVTFDNYIDTWVGKTKDGTQVKFTFAKQNVPTTSNYIQSANITGLTTEPLAGLVAVIKGTATITITNDSTMLFTMYMNKERDAINVTGTSIKGLTGSLALNLKRAK